MISALEFGVVFSFGLASGLHCLQMCGPIVLTYSLSTAPHTAWRAHLSYNAGRILVYMALGAAAGGLGGAIGALGRMAGVASGARIVAGVVMIAAGVSMAGLTQSNGLVALRKRGVTSRFSKAIGRILLAPGRKFRLGLMLGFLPCGLVYAALLKAMESAGPVSGAFTMLAFGAGTAVALLAVGMASSVAGARLRGPWSNRLAAASIAIAGAVLVWRGLTVPHCHG